MGELRRKAQMKILDASKKVDDSQLPIMGTLSKFFHENWNDLDMRSTKKLTRKSDDGEARRNSSERDTKVFQLRQKDRMLEKHFIISF